MKKAQETLLTFFATHPELHKDFELCVNHSLTPREFESSWIAMIEKHQVQDNEMLMNHWEKREIWVPAYFMHCYNPFLLSTLRSEAFNSVLKRYVSPSNSIFKFTKQYTAIQEKILGTEMQAEAGTTLKVPKMSTYMPMERQMMCAYTRHKFPK